MALRRGGDTHVKVQTYHVGEAAEMRAKYWSKMWKEVELDSARLQIACRGLAEEAREQALQLQPLSGDALASAARTIRAGTAMGVDGLTPREIGAWPADMLQDLAGQTRQWELEGALPMQLMANIMCALPKEGFAERLIALMPMPLRIYFRARGWLARGWTAGLQGFWDTAVKGSGALQAALKRALMHETSTELGVYSLS